MCAVEGGHFDSFYAYRTSHNAFYLDHRPTRERRNAFYSHLGDFVKGANAFYSRNLELASPRNAI